MNSIGIFGDSFASPYIFLGKGQKILHTLSWPVLLSKKFNVSFMGGVPGTSVFYSYKQFLENNANLDTIIFVITDSNRLYTNNHKLKISDLDTTRQKLKNIDVRDPDYFYYKAAELYHQWLSDAELNQFTCKKCLESIQNICQKENKRLILVPGFQNSDINVENFKVALVDVFLKELKTQFNNVDYKQENYRTRACHLSEKNNAILAELMAKIINGENITIGIDNFLFEKVSNPEKYWELV